MNRAPLLVALLLAAPAAWAQQPTTPDTPKKPSIRAEFDAALKVFNRDTQKAIAPLEKLVTTRWSELSAKGRHGAATLLMYAHLSAKQPAKAHTIGVAFHRRMPAAFLALSRLTQGRDLAGKAVRGALDVLALRTERWRSVVYLHNASRRDLRLDLGKAACAVTYAYTNRTAKVARHAAKGRLPGGIVVLPRGGGAFLHSPPKADAHPKTADAVTVLAYEAKRRLRGWIHLGEGGYRQTLGRLTWTAKARWGGQAWTEVTLVELTRGKAGGKTPRPKTTPTPTADGKHPRYARVGQRWTFRLPGGVTLVQQVLGLEPGGVKIRSTALVDGKPLRAPTTQLWKAPKPTTDPKALRERVVVSGRVFECRIVRAANGARLWSVPVFPGVVKSVHKGRTTLELIEVSEGN